MKLLLGTLASVLLLANCAQAQSLRLCTGGQKGNYNFFGQELASEVSGDVEIEVIQTKGSMDNLKKMAAGECDAGIAQSDAWFVYKTTKAGPALNMERTGVLFDEYVHLVCNKESDIDDVHDLADGHTVSIGKSGSGSWVTWNGLVFADKNYGGDAFSKVTTDNRSGSRALNAVIDGSETQCLLYVASPGTAFMEKVADESQESSKLVLTDVADKDFNDVPDPKGKSIYNPVELDNNTYPGFNLWSDVDTVAVSAILFFNTDWIDANEDAYESINDVLQNVVRNVRNKKGIN